jgi:glucosamine-6-phosphate deaminase
MASAACATLHSGAAFAQDYATLEDWKAAPCRVGARLHPFTIEQNAITSFRSSWPLIPCYANTIGPAIIFGSDYAIGARTGYSRAACSGRE